MELTPLSVVCPRCRSSDVTYTCEPRCCFNHLCGNCYGTFELYTTAREGVGSELRIPEGVRDSLAPSAACARCESVRVFLVSDAASDQAVCGDCRSFLTLGIKWTA